MGHDRAIGGTAPDSVNDLLSKHLPGPWKAITYPNGSFDVTRNNLIICSRNPWDHRARESCANARLIAAAPDLLTVLQNIISKQIAEATERAINERHGGDCTIIEAVTIALELAGVYEAIAKATG